MSIKFGMRLLSEILYTSWSTIAKHGERHILSIAGMRRVRGEYIHHKSTIEKHDIRGCEPDTEERIIRYLF